MEPPYMRTPFLNLIQKDKGLQAGKDEPVQQDDVFKKFFMEIAQSGLDYEYQKLIGNQPVPHRQTKKKERVLILGAGAAGLAAAYELAQVGHEVIIIERQERVGGRIKTVRKPFVEELHVDVGAMRLPGNGSDSPNEPCHFLTDFYLKQFKIQIKPFYTSNDQCYYSLYGDNIKIEDWKKDPRKFCSKYWPGWDANMTEETKEKIQGIEELLEATLEPVKDDLLKDLSEKGWRNWVKRWSVISMEDFLRSDQFPDENPMELRPWPEAAISAYRVATYGKLLTSSLVEVMRDLIGEWWKDPMHTPVDGMDALPKAFMKPNVHGWNHDVYLEKNIRYGIEVKRICYTQDSVTVTGCNTATGKKYEFEGKAAIVTFPLTVLRHIQFEPKLSLDKQKAIADITYLPSTKVALQCRTKFWELPRYGIRGGHSITNLPVGQVFYSDYPGAKNPPDERGILLCYNWTQDGLILGSQSEQEAVASAVRQIESLHTEISEEFEVGMAQSWYSDPTAMGCCAFLQPYEYLNHMYTLFEPEHPIYLAGEAISWSNGWIQGALESGLRTAYQFYSHNELEALSEDAGRWPQP